MSASTDSVAQEDLQELVPAPLSAEDAHAFWKTFLAQEAQLADLPSEECVEQVNQMIQRFSSSPALEVEGAEGAGPRGLVITAHGSKEHFADILLLQDTAPAMRAFSPVTAFRRRASDGSFEIRMEGFGLSTDEVLCQLFVDAGLVGIALRFDREIPMDMIDHAQHIAFIMLDHVIGEYDFAVRVGPVEFVEAFDSEVGPSVRLSHLADAFDQCWRATLGRTGELPADEDERLWDMLTLQSGKEGARPDILSHYRSANALATRSDLAFCVEVTVSIDNENLDRARDLQEALAGHIEGEKRGIHVMSLVRLDDALRTCTFYADSAHAWREAFEGICRKHGFSGAQIDVRFDPSWDAYLAYWPAPQA